MASAFLIGGTGLVGSNILSTLLSLPTVTSVHTLGRRAPPADGDERARHPTFIVEADTKKWASSFSAVKPVPSIFFSALGTTRAQAGGVEAQRLIDYDLNLEIATAAKAAGVKVIVLISSVGVSQQSMSAYGKMKADLEEKVKELGFDKTVILKPGLIVGERQDSRPLEAIARGIAKFLGGVSGGAWTNSWAQDASVIGRAAVSAGLKALEGEYKENVILIQQSDVVRLGKTEWKQ